MCTKQDPNREKGLITAFLLLCFDPVPPDVSYETSEKLTSAKFSKNKIDGRIYICAF